MTRPSDEGLEPAKVDLGRLPALVVLALLTERAKGTPELEAFVRLLARKARSGHSLTISEAIVMDVAGWPDVDDEVGRAA
jgi:hypothetical protein